MPNFSIDGIDELRELVQKAQQQQETLVEVAYLRGYLDGMEGKVIVGKAAPCSKETP